MHWKKINGKFFGIFIFFSVILSILSVTVVAYTGTITVSPAGGSSVTNINCGSNTQVQVNIQNNGGGQALCWYHTDKSATWVKGTSNCVPSGSGTTSFNANIEMLSSGSETRTLYVQCNDYVWPSSCTDTTQYASPSQCGLLSSSCRSSKSETFTYTVGCSTPKFTITPDKSSLSLTCGEPSVNVSINMQSQDTHNLQCVYRINNGQTIDINVPLIAGGTYSFSIPIGFPSPCTTQSINNKIDVACIDSISTLANTQSTSITVFYTTDPCKAALNDARNAISDAQTAITNAEKKIKEANELGADVTNATASLNKANSELTTAQTSVATAQSSCDSGDRTNGVTQANSAKTSATQAKTYATDALNSAQQSITTFTQKKTDASNKISDANSAIDTTTIAVNKGEGALNNATQLSSVLPEAVQGVDLATEKANINTARLKLDQAKNYIKEAQTAFDQKNFDLAKSKATSAIDLSNEANKLSTDSYTRINAVLLTLGEAGKAILSATNEISQTDEILSKMDYVIKSVEKYGVNLEEAKEITSTGQTNIDEAKDLLSQAKNRLQVGVSTDAVDKAIDARDKAAEPTNRLNRIVDSMSSSAQDALEEAYANAEQLITNAENSVNGAASTFGATQSEVLAAQDALAKAKSQLVNATSLINEVKSATGLQEFVSKSTLAFSALQEAESQVKSAQAHASSAKMGLVTKVVIPAAAGVGAIGGGFLFWRMRRKKKLPISKVEKEIEKEWKMFCKTCKKEYSTVEKFCSVCGKKLKKLTGEHKRKR